VLKTTDVIRNYFPVRRISLHCLHK